MAPAAASTAINTRPGFSRSALARATGSESTATGAAGVVGASAVSPDATSGPVPVTAGGDEAGAEPAALAGRGAGDDAVETGSDDTRSDDGVGDDGEGGGAPAAGGAGGVTSPGGPVSPAGGSPGSDGPAEPRAMEEIDPPNS